MMVEPSRIGEWRGLSGLESLHGCHQIPDRRGARCTI
jgi:hypothetical protein